MVRAPFVDKNGLKKGAWSPEEDEKLRAYIQKYGIWNWRELPKFAGLSRCGKSCRLRWLNYLRPDVKHGNYSKEEEDLIIKLHQQLGNKWSLIATKLPGRTDNEIKNHWHSHLKKRVKQSHSTSSELQVQSSEKSIIKASQIGVSQLNRELEAESCSANITTHPVFEITPLSPEISCSEFSCNSSNSTLVTVSDANRIPENCLTSFDKTFEVSSGDFWTEPFIADHTFNQHDCLAPSTLDGLIFPFIEDNMDLFYQLMMQESML